MSLMMVARRRANGDDEGPAAAHFLQRVPPAYRVLFTRALTGVYDRVPATETRAHLASAIEWT
jgi:hypothetical protein